MTTQSCDVLGFRCYAGRFDAAVDAVLARVRSGDGGYACLGNAHVLVTALHDDRVRRALNDAWTVFPDGAPVSWIQRRRGLPAAQRIAGPDLMPVVIEAGLPWGVRHFLLGSSGSVVGRLRARIEMLHPGVRIVGLYSPSREELDADDCHMVEIARAAAPDVIWCAFGAPRQELWMAAHAKELAPAVVVGVGAAFDFLSGEKGRAPVWMQCSGLEWLHRLMHEPRRLARRYLQTNTEFVLRALLDVTLGRES